MPLQVLLIVPKMQLTKINFCVRFILRALLENKNIIPGSKKAPLRSKLAILENKRAILENKRTILENKRAIVGVKRHFWEVKEQI